MSSIFSKLKQVLAKTSDKISDGIEQIFIKKKLDNSTLEKFEELLISADFGIELSAKLIENLKSIKFSPEVNLEQIKEKIAELIMAELENYSSEFKLEPGLNIVLICGVNGNGKTTTIGKLASYYHDKGKRVAIAACDTYRAAAIEQLASWAGKSNCLFITGNEKSEPASVAYQAIEQAQQNNIDLLFIDTAGRLHNHQNLMAELAKIDRVIKKINKQNFYHSLLVVDATTGQNIYNQVQEFDKITKLSGLILTKLDGSAKAGMGVGIITKYKIPIFFLGVGEKLEDIRPFDPQAFAKALVGL